MLEPAPLPKERLEALTDGIFAVSMTILVLDLKLPTLPVAGEEVWQAVLAAIPAVDDYVISFVLLCVFWIGHLRLMRRIKSIDGVFMWLNLAFLLFTTFVPALTAFANRNPGHPRPAILYGADLCAILVCQVLTWRHSLRGLANETVTDPRAVWKNVRLHYLTAIGVVVLGIALAVLEIRMGMSQGMASYTYLLLIVAGVMRPAHATRAGKPS
jgi:uncharacterized membrane protein